MDLLVGCFSLEDLHIPEEQKEHHYQQNRRGNRRRLIAVVRDDEPDHETSCDKEQNTADNGEETLHSELVDVEEVDDEENDIDNDDDKVETRYVAETTVSEARTTSVPVGAEKRAEDESSDDLEDLDDTSVGLKVASVELDVSHDC